MTNPTTNTPAAACRRCGGWTTYGGMSQHAHADAPIMGRTGCTCHRSPDPLVAFCNGGRYDPRGRK
jgi:hypothetical protein